MLRKVITYIRYPVLIAVMVLCLIAVAQAATGNIDPTDKWAWGTNVGWINFRPEHGGVTVYSDHLEGYAWGENIGWIRLGTHTGGGEHTYANTAADNYGVNNDGKLSGYAWGTNVGWINFAPAHSQVTIDPATGRFDGYAWGENIGWIHFRGTGAVAYGVVWSHTLTVSINTTEGGSGRVTSEPAGIFCGEDCAGSFGHGMVVTLTAHPGVQSYLASWSGDCISTGALTAQVTMDADKTCTATFGYPVGGIVVPVDKLGLLAPWLGLAALASLAALTVALVRRRKP